MSASFSKWLLFGLLAFIWGSSFILIKEGLVNLDPFQVASIRILSSGIVLLPVALKVFRQIPPPKRIYVFLSGVMGSLLPAYLFCIAEQELDSALAGTLNSLTPIFVIIVGALFFNNKTSALKIIGILIAFAGSVLLYFNQPGTSPNNLLYVLYIVAATLLYGINVNMVQRQLKDIPSLHAVAVALATNAVLALVVLIFNGYFRLNFSDAGVLASSGYAFLLGVFGTAIASVLFYMLIKKAGAVFSSMVTYGIPLVANAWGLAYGETVGPVQLLCLLIILAGVFVANKNFKRAVTEKNPST